MSALQKKIFKFLEDKNEVVINLVSASKAGWPDLIWVHDGLFIGIEVKQALERVSALQENKIERLARAGAICEVVRNFEGFKRLYASVLGNRPAG